MVTAKILYVAHYIQSYACITRMIIGHVPRCAHVQDISRS